MSERGSVVRRELGRRLRDLRVEAGKSALDVEGAGLVSQSKLVRIETGAVSVQPADVLGLCRFYGADRRLSLTLAQLAEDGLHGLDHWGEERRVQGSFQVYQGLESTCSAMFTYCPEVVHGLLQTDEYTDYVLGSDGQHDPEVLQERHDVRVHRMLTFFGREDVRLTMVLGVAALARGAATPDVLGRLYRHLCHLSSGERINVRVLPATLGVRAEFYGAFTLFEFDQPDEPAVAYVETHVGAHYFERAKHVATYRAAMNALIQRSIPIQEHSDDESLDQVLGQPK